MNPYLAWGILVAISWLMFASGYLVGRLTTRIHQTDEIVAEIDRQFETSRDESRLAVRLVQFLTWLELIFPDRIGFPDKTALARGYVNSEFLAAAQKEHHD